MSLFIDCTVEAAYCNGDVGNHILETMLEACSTNMLQSQFGESFIVQ